LKNDFLLCEFVEVASKVIGVMDEWIMSFNKIIPRGITLVCFAQMMPFPSTLVAKSGFTTLVKENGTVHHSVPPEPD